MNKKKIIALAAITILIIISAFTIKNIATSEKVEEVFLIKAPI